MGCEEQEKVKKVKPKTGPRPASSMPIMQGFDAHFGTLLASSDPILAHSQTQSQSHSRHSLTLSLLRNKTKKGAFSISRHQGKAAKMFWLWALGLAGTSCEIHF